MSNDYWKEFKRLVKRAEKASGGNSATEHNIAYTLMLNYAERHAPIKSEIAARADARIAELDRECAQWREELRIYRETENKRIAELEQSVTVRDTEIARLETDLELARIGARRYETARRMDPRMWADACKLNLFTGKHFDEIIDELRPFMLPQDAARAGNGGGV